MADARLSAIGKYEIIELIGEGAMGVVYKATDSVLERIVAIKVMSASLVGQESLRERFLREARAAGSLQHQNVVTIHDFGEVDHRLFIAMEFIEGVDLEHLLKLSEPVSVEASLDIIIDVLHGLAYAHKRGIVHRDIKPANIRLGEDGRARIMDFGVAHLMSSTFTSSGAVLGTPTYMAPEQIAEGRTSAATDIFSVGAVLYQVLTMVRPFDAENLPNLMFKIVIEHPRPVSELVPGLPPALDRIVEKAMAKEPDARYTNALDMANDLAIVRSRLSGASVDSSDSAQRTSEQSRRGLGAGRRKIAYLAGGALAAASLLVIPWSQFARFRAASPAPLVSLAPIVVSDSPAVPNATSSGAPRTPTRGSPRAPLVLPRSQSVVAESSILRKIGTRTSPALPPASRAESSSSGARVPPAGPTPPASMCGGNPHCAEVSSFVATVTDLHQSVIDGGGTRVVSVTVRFRNRTAGPLALGYVSGSGVVTDDRGNRYTPYNVRGLGVIGSEPGDPKFVLRAGESADARFEFMWNTGGALFGTRFVVDLAVREIESLAANQWRPGQEHVLHFSGFGAPEPGTVQQ